MYLPDAGSHLQRALHVFREVIRKSNATAQRQKLITENASEAYFSLSSDKGLPTLVSAYSE